VRVGWEGSHPAQLSGQPNVRINVYSGSRARCPLRRESRDHLCARQHIVVRHVPKGFHSRVALPRHLMDLPFEMLWSDEATLRFRVEEVKPLERKEVIDAGTSLDWDDPLSGGDPPRGELERVGFVRFVDGPKCSRRRLLDLQGKRGLHSGILYRYLPGLSGISEEDLEDWLWDIEKQAAAEDQPDISSLRSVREVGVRENGRVALQASESWRPG